MVNFNINTPSMACILFRKPPLYASVATCNLVSLNVMYVAF